MVKNFDDLVRGAELVRGGDRQSGAAEMWDALRSTHVRLSGGQDRSRSQALGAWFTIHHPTREGQPLESSDDDSLMTVAAMFEALLDLPGIGPTGASKILWAFCPSSAIPNDAAMRESLGFAGSPAGYYGYLRFARSAIGNLAAAARVSVEDLPARVGQPVLSNARLLDAFLWLVGRPG